MEELWIWVLSFHKEEQIPSWCQNGPWVSPLLSNSKKEFLPAHLSSVVHVIGFIPRSHAVFSQAYIIFKSAWHGMKNTTWRIASSEINFIITFFVIIFFSFSLIVSLPHISTGYLDIKETIEERYICIWATEHNSTSHWKYTYKFWTSTIRC